MELINKKQNSIDDGVQVIQSMLFSLALGKSPKIFKSWKMFLEPDFIFIARKNEDNSPIGFTMSIPNYYEIIRKMKGKLNLKGIGMGSLLKIFGL